MTEPLCLTALGTPLRLTFTGAGAGALRAALEPRWALCRTDGGPPVTTIQVAATTGDLAAQLVDVTHRVTQEAVGAGRGQLLMFHAAGVCDQTTGATVIGVAPGGTGKTTLCRTLAPGRGYVSDETVAVSADGSVRPYPKPLSVRRPRSEVKDEVAPAELGLEPPAVAPYAAAVLLLDRRGDGPQEPEVGELDLFDAIVGLTPETSSLSRLPRPLHRLADLLERVAPVVRVRYREAASLEPLVASLIGPPTRARR